MKPFWTVTDGPHPFVSFPFQNGVVTARQNPFQKHEQALTQTAFVPAEGTDGCRKAGCTAELSTLRYAEPDGKNQGRSLNKKLLPLLKCDV